MVILNSYGFYELAEKPSQSDLNAYYAQKYYQESDTHSYYASYTDEETRYYYQKAEQKHQNLIAQGVLQADKTYRLLDVGCGEGFALEYFRRQGWDIVGIEYSDYACRRFHPDCLAHLRTGDVQQRLQECIAQQEQYDLVWLDNVLEHVLDPLELLQQLRSIGKLLVVEVPNDFSSLQQALLERQQIDRAFWVVAPDHISYFNKKGLVQLAETAGWQSINTLSDFPIDWFLTNDFSNYNRHKNTGKQAHYARVQLDNLFHDQSIEKTNRLYEALADLGMGRQIVAFFK